MKLGLSVCAAVLVMLSPSWMHAAGTSNSTATNSQPSHQRAIREAKQMVPAHATLLEQVSAKKFHVGEQVQARLQRAVQLQDGSQLPDGTLLLGKVTQDVAQPDNVKLAMRFNQAKLKDGSTVPVKTMIISIQKGNYYADVNGTTRVPTRDIWTPGTFQVDAPNQIDGADLHSNITSSNSVLISSTKKDNVELAKGSELDLVIGTPQNVRSSRNSKSSM